MARLSEKELKDFEKKWCESFNADEGSMHLKDGVDCHKCKNKGYIAYVDPETQTNHFLAECECMEQRRAIREMEKSGISDTIKRYTFENFKAETETQKQMLKTAKEFLSNPKGRWLYIGGQVGAGKTHICSAVVGELLKRGYAARYIRWRDEVQQAKRLINDNEKYGRMIDGWKRVQVLYIDDLFKGNSKSGTVNDADTNIAMEILDYRYHKKDLITILSGEKSLDYLMQIDEAVGSRIYERCKNGTSVYIEPAKGKNYRTANAETKTEPEYKPRYKNNVYWHD
jgi:DNA replication protein DnaC